MILSTNTYEIDRIIYKIKYHKSFINIFICIFMSIALSVLSEYGTPRPFSLHDAIQFSFVLMLIILIVYYFLTKEGVAIQSKYVDQAIKNILIDDWSLPPLKAFLLTNAVLRHPIFISLIGLYSYKYGKKDQGLSLISMAQHKLPIIGEAIKDGSISDKRKFEELRNIINRDLYPKTFVKLFKISIFIYGLIAIMLVICLGIYFLLHYFK